MQLVGIVGANLVKVLWRHGARDVKLAGPITIEFRHLLRHDMMEHEIDRRFRIVPVVLVPVQLDHRARLPVRQHVGAIRKQVAGAGERIAVLADRAAMHRERARVGQKAQQIRGRSHQRDDERAIVGRRDAELARFEFSCDDAGSVDDIAELGRIKRGRIGIDEPPQAEHEVCRRDGIPVRPAGLGPNAKRVGQAVLRNIPAFRCGRDHLAGCVIAHKALADVPQHIRSLHAATLLWVEGFGLGGQRTIQRRRIGLRHPVIVAAIAAGAQHDRGTCQCHEDRWQRSSCLHGLSRVRRFSRAGAS